LIRPILELHPIFLGPVAKDPHTAKDDIANADIEI
jgi:hypothetical protein